MEGSKESIRYPMLPLLHVDSVYPGSIIYAPGGGFGPRVQHDLQLVILDRGEMTVTVDEIPHSIAAGFVILLKPGHREMFTFAKTEETWHRWIAVTVRNIPQEVLQYFERLSLQIPLSEEMDRLTELLLTAKQRSDPEDPYLCSLGRAALQLFVMECCARNKSAATHPSILLAKQMVHKHYRNDLSLIDLARFAGITPEYLVRLFRQFEKTTPMHYVWSFRIRQSIELLRSTGLSIGEVAEQSGFKSPYHFSRIFKKHTGVTPSELRRSHWSGKS